jgi:hypothetical protein
MMIFFIGVEVARFLVIPYTPPSTRPTFVGERDQE